MSAAAPFLASPQRRLGAAAIDAAPVLLFSIFALAAVDLMKLAAGTMLIAVPLIFLAYHAAFNYYWSGETPGRRLFDIRVVNARPALDLTSAQCVVRPLVRTAWILSLVPLAASLRNPWYSVLPAIAISPSSRFCPGAKRSRTFFAVPSW